MVPSLWVAFHYADLPQLGGLHDDALYLIGAKSLAETGDYRVLSLEGAPAQTKYPPLFPLWLASAWRIGGGFPENLAAMLPLVWIWLPVFGLFSRPVFGDLGFDERWRTWLPLAVLVNPVAAYFSVNLMPELMCGSLILLALALAERERPAWAGLVAGFAFLAKSSALPLFLSIPLLYGLRRQYGLALRYGVTAAPAFFGWAAWSAANRQAEAARDYYLDYAGYYLGQHPPSELPALIVHNVPVMLAGAGRLFLFTAESTWLTEYLATLLGLASFAGLWKLGRRVTQHHVFAALFLTLLACWNFPPHERFLLPILPLILAGAANIVRTALALPVIRWAALAAVAGLLTTEARLIAGELPALAAWKRRERDETQRVYDYIVRETPVEARWLTVAHDPMLYLHTGRTARRIPFPTAAFYRGSRDAILAHYSQKAEFARRHSLDWVWLDRRDHAEDLDAAATNEIVRRTLADPGLHLRARLGPSFLFSLDPLTLAESDPHWIGPAGSAPLQAPPVSRRTAAPVDAND